VPPNIILVVLDCVRADGLGVYGNPRPVTPRLDALAASSRVYMQARSAAVWTLPSHASLFTGLHPRQHGVDSDHPWLEASIPTLAETLGGVGYQTAAFSTNAWVGPHFGLDRGFDHFAALWRVFPSMGKRPFPQWEKALRKWVLERGDKGAAKLNDHVRRWWGRQRDPARPFFLFALYLDAHLPYRPPQGYAERLLPAPALAAARLANQDAWAYMAGEVAMTPADFEGLRGLYDAEISYVDEKIGELLDFLEASGGLDHTVVIVTADHGENIGDHGLMDHQYCVYDSLARVPLLVHYPEAFASGPEHMPVQHTDLLPTLLDLAQAGSDRDLPGRSLLAPPDPSRPRKCGAITQYTGPHRHRFARRHPHFDPASRGYDRTFDGLVLDDYKLIRSSRGEQELYHLAADPTETSDLALLQPARVDALGAMLDAWLAEHPVYGASSKGLHLDKGLAKHFEGLGYL
jgi:arylsulfatase A-like enzyme